MNNEDSKNKDLPQNAPTPHEQFNDLDMLNFEQSIKDEQANHNPLVGNLESIDRLAEEYASGSSIYQEKIKNLSVDYNQLRRCRGDGNCFFRAFSFSMYEKLLEATPETYNRFLQIIQSSQEVLYQAGFQAIVIEDFYEDVLKVFEEISPNTSSDVEKKRSFLLKTFQTDETSNSIVAYLRFLTSAYLKLNVDEYLPFLLDDPSIVQLENSGNPNNIQPMDHFCNINVEAIGKESDEIHITALTSVLNLPVQVAYLDGHSSSNSSSSVNFHRYPASGTNSCELLDSPISLLYRPGHYDILYPK